MATIYRWRKSTIKVVFDEETRGPDTRPVQFVLEDFSGSVTCNSKGSGYQYNGDGNVTLNSPTYSQSIRPGNAHGFSPSYFTAQSNPASELFYASGNSNTVEWQRTDFGETLIYGMQVDGFSQGPCTRRYNFRNGPGTSQGYVYSTSSSAYPNGGASGGYWYSNRTTITINITVPSIVMQGNEIPVSWNTVSGATEYFLERQADGGSWTQVYNGSTNSYTDTAGSWSNVKYRLRMTISGTMTPYVESSTCQVVSASTLAISGTDGDLGTLTNDVEYTVISDGDSAITVTEAVDGVYTKTFTATAGATNKISVLDLLTGTGSIRITASTNPGSGVLEVERAWTYSKTAAMFSAYGNTAELKRNGVPVWPLTLAECVRLPGGKTLDVGMLQIETGSYTGTGTHGQSNPNTLTFAGKPVLIFLRANQYAGSLGNIAYPIIPGQVGIAFVNANGNDGNAIVSFDGNTMSYYSTSSADSQFNHVGVLYDYAALTIGGDTE